MVPGQRYTFADHAADHLAWRKSSYIATLVFAWWLLAFCVAGIVANHWVPGSASFAIVMGPVDLYIFGVLWRLRRKWAREPIPRTLHPPDSRGVGTTRKALTAIFVVPTIYPLLVMPQVLQGQWAALLGSAVIALPWIVFFGSCFGPGILIRARKHELLAHTLATDPAAKAAWDDIEAHYPHDAPFPFR